MTITVETQTAIVQIADVRRQAEDDAEAPHRPGALYQKEPHSTEQRCRAVRARYIRLWQCWSSRSLAWGVVIANRMRSGM